MWNNIKSLWWDIPAFQIASTFFAVGAMLLLAKWL